MQLQRELQNTVELTYLQANKQQATYWVKNLDVLK